MQCFNLYLHSVCSDRSSPYDLWWTKSKITVQSLNFVTSSKYYLLATDELGALMELMWTGISEGYAPAQSSTADKHIFILFFSAEHKCFNSLGLACQASISPSRSPRAGGIPKFREKMLFIKEWQYYVIAWFLEEIECRWLALILPPVRSASQEGCMPLCFKTCYWKGKFQPNTLGYC